MKPQFDSPLDEQWGNHFGRGQQHHFLTISSGAVRSNTNTIIDLIDPSLKLVMVHG
jgi:hypothetical protein